MAYVQKTKPQAVPVERFIGALADPGKRADAEALILMMQGITGEPAVMWGPSMVGFGRYRYTYASGHGGESFALGFSPRKAVLTIYVAQGVDANADIMDRLGPHKSGKGCLYVKRLADIDLATLEELLRRSLDYLRGKYPD
jgi:hypothetical protein